MNKKIKSLLKEIISYELRSILKENKQIHPLRFDKLKSIAVELKKIFQAEDNLSKAKNDKEKSTYEISLETAKRTLGKEIYEYYTRFYEEYDSITPYRLMVQDKTSGRMVRNPNLNRELKQKADDLWGKMLSDTEQLGSVKGWIKNDSNPAWVQFEKRSSSSAPKEPRTDSYKIYITFNRGKDLKDFKENMSKLPILLDKINSKQMFGKVSFKVANIFTAALEEKDNVVIHFKDIRDEESIRNAIAETGFSTVDRSTIDRTELGLDTTGEDGKHSSDSEVAKQSAVRNLTSDTNKPILSNFLNKSENTEDYKQGLSQIQKILQYVMLNISRKK